MNAQAINLTKMNATIVMNNADLLSHQILPFAIHSRPSCCDKCKAVLPLHIFKVPTVKHTFAHQSFPQKYYSLQDIPKEIRDNEDLMATVEPASVFGEENKWFCDKCWCWEVAYHTNILQLKVAKAIKNANPNFDEKQINKEIKLIKEGGLLFKTHRIKKTQEKAKLYEEYVYSALRERFSMLKKEHLDYAKYHKNSIAKYIEKVKMKVCKDNSRQWVKEIRQRKIAKWFAERKISYKFHNWITSQMYNHCPFPTWEEFSLPFSFAYNTPIPKWWKDL